MITLKEATPLKIATLKTQTLKKITTLKKAPTLKQIVPTKANNNRVKT